MSVREIKFRFWHRADAVMFAADRVTIHQEGVTLWREDDFEPEINPEGSLMQFTGMVDRMGREVYEGDIIRFHDEARPASHRRKNLCVVEFFDLGFRPRWIRDDKGRLNAWNNSGVAHFLEELASMEVVGNIHANPELGKPE